MREEKEKSFPETQFLRGTSVVIQARQRRGIARCDRSALEFRWYRHEIMKYAQGRISGIDGIRPGIMITQVDVSPIPLRLSDSLLFFLSFYKH